MRRPGLWAALSVVLSAAALAVALRRHTRAGPETCMPERPVGKWPHYAEWHRMSAYQALCTIERKTREAHELLRQGAVLDAVVLLADVRAAAADGRVALEQAKQGERGGAA